MERFFPIARWPLPGSDLLGRFDSEAKYLALGLAAGVLCYMALGLLFLAFPGHHLVLDLTRFLAFFLAAVLGYAWARRRSLGQSPAHRSAEAAPRLRVLGWRQAEQRISTWFSTEIRQPPTNAAERIANLIQTLGLET